jgi:type II secretory pathway pseudopilin PulG
MKKHLPLIVGLALPVLFIIIISLVVFLPSITIKPQHNFLYTKVDSYNRYGQSYTTAYKVEDSKITTVITPIPNYKELYGTTTSLLKEAVNLPDLYLYDVKSNTSHKITLDQAQTYTLDPGPSSPDGYTVAYNYSNDGIFDLFGSSNSNDGYFISKGNGKKKLNSIDSDGYYSSSNFRLIGWIK